MSGAVWKIFSPRLDSAVSAHFRSPLPLSPSPLIWCPWRTEDDNERPPKRGRRRRGASFLLPKGLRPTHKLVVHKLPQMRATSCCCCVDGGGGGGGPLHSAVIFAIVIPEASPPPVPPSPPLSFLRRSAGDRPAEGPLGQTTRIRGQ